MKTHSIQTILILASFIATPCRAAPRVITGAFVAEEHVLRGTAGSADAVSEVTIWKKTKQGRLLVCKIVRQSGLIVSIMPTPIQTDAIRPTGHFVTVGNGWSPSTLFYLEERGRLYLTREDAEKRKNELTADKLSTLLAAHDKNGMPNVYLTVEQNTPYNRFEEVFGALVPASETLGVGWQKGWW